MGRDWQAYTLIKFIEDSNNKIQNIAEVGIWRGKTTRRILEQCHGIISQYWAIDSWIHSPSAIKKKLTNEQWDDCYQDVCGLMCQFSKLHILRMTSLDAAKLFPKKYFDLVFIDADHSYDAVLADIKAWEPLINDGGLLTGHDYGGKKTGVKKAIDEYFREIEVMSIGMWLRRIEKNETTG